MKGEDEPSGWSNIVHQMVGMGNLFTVGSRRETLEYEIPLPTVPAWGTPLPPLEEDAEPPCSSLHPQPEPGLRRAQHGGGGPFGGVRG